MTEVEERISVAPGDNYSYTLRTSGSTFLLGTTFYTIPSNQIIPCSKTTTTTTPQLSRSHLHGRVYEPLESGGWPRGRPFDVLADHVVFGMESIDRMSLNVYVPGLQYPARLVAYVHRQLEPRIASTAPLALISEGLTTALRGSPGDRFH